MVVAYVSIAPDYIGRHQEEEPNPKRQKKYDSCASNLGITTNTEHENATEIQNIKKRREETSGSETASPKAMEKKRFNACSASAHITMKQKYDSSNTWKMPKK